MKRKFALKLFVLAVLIFVFAEQWRGQSFSSRGIEILLNPDVDIVYHALAHFDLKGDPSNLYSPEYLQRIREAREHLEVGETRLQQLAPQLEKEYRRHPRLRFLNLAPFMADDFASFKQALLLIDYNFRTKTAEDPRGSSEDDEEKKEGPLMFLNTRRLIPLLKNRFPEPAEREFVKKFGLCLEDEAPFYKMYREARSELDETSLEWFRSFWEAEGAGMLAPWAARSRADTFKVYLSPVMKNNGRGIPVNEAKRVHFNIVAPLPESKERVAQSFFVVFHETIHRSTDDLVDEASAPDEASVASFRENAAFLAGQRYLKSRFPKYHESYLRFFLNLESAKTMPPALEAQFERVYPVPQKLKSAVEDLVKNL